MLDETSYSNAAEEFRYNTMVFCFPAWEKIYTNDAERKMSFEKAKEFETVVRSIYENFGYRILEVPRCSLEERVKFILDRVSNQWLKPEE
jgi:predicted ATPase